MHDRRLRAIVLVLVVATLAAGCMGGSNGYAKYQDKDASVRKIDAVLATIPQYPGAHLATRQTISGSYHVAPDDFITARPYSGDFYYAISEPVSAAAIQGYFRRAMPAHGWQCRFRMDAAGVPSGFGCTRGRGTLGAVVSDQGYEFQVGFGQKRPPIKTIPGD